MSKIIDKVTEIAKPVVEKNGCELWDVKYIKEAGNCYLRVFIDRVDGVSINHCELISRELDKLLDEYDDLFPESYIFEVSSAGLERVLRGQKDFERFKNQNVEIKLYKAQNGQKIYHGNLNKWDDDGIQLDINAIQYTFDEKDVALVRLLLQ